MGVCVTVISSTTISCLHKKANFPSRLSCDVFFFLQQHLTTSSFIPLRHLLISLSYVPFIVIVIIFFPSLTFLFLNELLFISIHEINISNCYKNFHTAYKPIGKFGNFSHTCHQQIYFVDACCSSFDICFKIELF